MALTFTPHVVPSGFQQWLEASGQVAQGGSSLVYANGAYYYITIGMGGAGVATENLWIVKSTDGVNWSSVVNSNRGYTGGFAFLAVAVSGNTIYIAVLPLSFSTTITLFTFNAGPDTFSADSNSPLTGNSLTDKVGLEVFQDGSVLATGISAGTNLAASRYNGTSWGAAVVIGGNGTNLVTLASQAAANRIYIFYTDGSAFLKCVSIDNTGTLGTPATLDSTGSPGEGGLATINGADVEVVLPVVKPADANNNVLSVYRAPCAANPSFTKETVQSGIAGQNITEYFGIYQGGPYSCAFSFGGNLYAAYGTAAGSNCFLYLQTNTGPGNGWSATTTIDSASNLQPAALWYTPVNSGNMALLWGEFNNNAFFFGNKYGSLSLILYLGSAGPLAASCGNPPPGTLGNSYTGTPSASGGSAPYHWAITSGALPPGLSMNSNTGAISGTPTATGALPFYSFTISVTDAANNTVSVNCAIPVWDSAPPAPGNNGGGGGGGSGVVAGNRTELFLWQIQSLPDQVFDWRSQFISHGLKGYQHIYGILAAYSSIAAVTLSFQVFDGTAPAAITLPSTGGIVQRIWLVPTFNKFRLIRYLGSSSLPFQIPLSDWLVKVGEWGRQGQYVSYQLLGEG